MITKLVTITHKFGIHARPAAKIVSLCMGFQCDLEIVKSGEPPANAKNILDIMMLAAAQGVELELRAKGSDAQEAITALASLVASDFDSNEI